MESKPEKGELESLANWKKDDESIGAESPVGFATASQSTPTPPPQTRRREDRPVSRRGMASRQGQGQGQGQGQDQGYGAEERPRTQQSGGRPTTASAFRMPSAAPSAPRGSVVPGTASRLTSALRQSPASRMGTALPFSGAQVNVVDRPITQQGLSGLRTATRGPQMRQVQDKRYFESLLQTKIRDLTNEITRLGKETEELLKEQTTFVVYEKRVKDMASELTELQGELADYNLVVDKINTDTNKSEVDKECQELQSHNKQEAQVVEQLFTKYKQRESFIQQLEREIEEERHMTDNLLQAMSPPLREKYSELQKTNVQLQQSMESLQQQLDSLNSRKNALEDQLAVSQMKQEAVKLHHKLQEAEEKKQTLLEEEKNRSTPAQEREQLLKRVKDDNAEIATMERQIGELKDLIRKKQEDMEQVEQDLDESQSERHQKYRELRRREETMEQFLSGFEESKSQEMARIKQQEEQIINTLQQISKNLVHGGHLPSVDEFSAIKDNLSFKEGELEKSKNTVEGLTKEHQQLQLNLQKVEALEDKIKLEMETLHQKMANMTSEMSHLSDLDRLQREADLKKSQLDKEYELLEKKRSPGLEALRESQNKYNTLKRQLDENETYAQLSNLERKLSQLEQNNFAIREYIESKRSETDYEPLQTKVFGLVQEYNACIKETLK